MKRLLHNCILATLTWAYQRGNLPRFRKWLELEKYKEKIVNAVEGGNLPEWMLLYLSTAFWGLDYKWFERADWMKLVAAFYVVLSKSPSLSFPITSPVHEKHKEESWDYPDRTWYLYSHLLAKTYGWTLEYISNLSVHQAIASLEEIIVDEQLDREFYHGLSEMAYAYDKSTKTSKFVPLPRPAWMREKPKEIQKFKIPAYMMPMGVSNYENALPAEYLPKEIQT